jgi:sulfur relay (sulfurtransferase) DsrF/TusC family protein
MAKTLQIIENAYRVTIEEQDDPAVWITHAMKGAGAELGVLLRGNAVNYAAKGQDATGLRFGGRAQTQPVKLDKELTGLIAKGVEIYFVEDDAKERGLETDDLIEGPKPIAKKDLPRLLGEYERVWHW